MADQARNDQFSVRIFTRIVMLSRLHKPRNCVIFAMILSIRLRLRYLFNLLMRPCESRYRPSLRLRL
ncbi:hypothetical protein D1872_303460 [compost metagenome]